MPADQLIDRIMDSARSRLPGAIDTSVYFELWSVLDEFFNVSTVWRERIYVPVVADTLTYELSSIDLPSRVTALIGFENSNALPYAAYLNSDNILSLRYQYEPGDYYAWCVLSVVKRINDEQYPRFPQWVSDRFADVIADGVVGRMMAAPAKPYSSPQHALFYSRKFRAGCQEARIEVGRQNIIGAQNWRFPRFAAQG